MTLIHYYGICHAVMSAVSGLQGEISWFGTSKYFLFFFFTSLDACVVYFTVWCQERTEDIIWGQISLCGVLKVLLYLFFLFTM
jgi:hypothetical protein